MASDDPAIASGDLFSAGKFNEVIAYEMQMSESAVAIHLRHTMNIKQATTRTEMVCAAYSPWAGVLVRPAPSSPGGRKARGCAVAVLK